MSVKHAFKRYNNVQSEDSERKYDVCGLGNPLVDILTYVDDDFLKENNLHKGIMHLIDAERKAQLLEAVSEREYVMEVGGACPNTISTLGLLGLRVALTGGIGNDLYGTFFEERLKERGIDSFLRRVKEDTGVSIILITPDGERTMNTYLGACREFRKEHLPVEMVKSSRFFYFTGYMWDTENQKEAVKYAIDIARKNKVKVAFDLADPFAVERYRNEFFNLIRDRVDIVFANAREAWLMQNPESGQKAVSIQGKDIQRTTAYLGSLCETAVVKNGSRETHISYTGKITIVPSFKTNVKDTTGAGDSFAAGFLYGLIKGYPLEKCGRIASFVASKTIEKVGAQAPENIKELLDEMLLKDRG
jgi:sugar/nucleoside kinase (ribokinase family)